MSGSVSVRKCTLLLLFFSLSAFADKAAEKLNTLSAQTTLDYFTINSSKINLGLLGIHYDLSLLPVHDFYTGVGLYGAVTGNTGGFFALGMDNNYNPRLYKSLYFDSGVFLGGGGAHGSAVGGGLMVLPHVGLSYSLGPARIKLDYSYITFPSGSIQGSQVMAGVIIPSTFYYFSPGDSVGMNDSIHWEKARLYLSPLLQLYYPEHMSHVGLIGAEGGKFLTDRAYLAIRTTAIAAGNSGN